MISNVVVFYDEVDLVFVKVCVKLGGGYVGNNGIRFISVYFGLEFYWVWIGVGYLGDKNFVLKYVLNDFFKVDV